MREKFEKLPEIAERLKNYKIAFYNGEYIAEGRVDDCKLWIAVGFVGGAWYAFQEQQKKIDSMLDHVCGSFEDFK